MQSTKPEDSLSETSKLSCERRKRDNEKVWSMDRQVRFTAGLLILDGIALSTINMNWIVLSVVVALGMVVSAISNTCAMSTILGWLPWNRNTH
ncbi:MAG: hypothetical protein C0507_21495 [Cyanobacteria bacterium PR.3.49]|jgi:hypothetical protein|nr:hypothetical protein [Cyanobacteria bacterium PR.3.49]